MSAGRRYCLSLAALAALLVAVGVAVAGVAGADAARGGALADAPPETAHDASAHAARDDAARSERTPPDTLSRFEGRIIEAVELSGYKITRRFVIERELHMGVGDPFSAAALDADLVRLENLGVFSSVDWSVTEFGEGVTIRYMFREMPWIIGLPIVISSDQDGVSYGVGVGALNLAGRGILASGSVLFGGLDTGELALVYPWITGNHLSFDLVAAKVERDDDFLNFREQSIEFSPWVGTWIGEHFRFRGGFSYLQMKSAVDSVTIDPDKKDNLVRVGIAVGVDTRDRWRNPRSGWRGELMVMQTGALGGDGDSWLGELSLERWQPTFDRQNFLIYGLASLQSGSVGTDVPLYLQYRMGGANSIRGYDVDELGRERFGKHQLLGTVAYEWLLMPLREVSWWKLSVSTGLKLAAFVDVGTAWNTDAEFRWSRAKVSYGLGARWLVPGLSVVRFDMGFTEDGDSRFQIGINDKAVSQRLRLR